MARFFDGAAQLLKEVWNSAIRWIERLARWFGRLFRSDVAPDQPGISTATAWTLLSLLAAVLVAAGALFWWRARGRVGPTAIAAEVVSPSADIGSADELADRLPEEEWTRLGQELAARGEWRQAVRALHLAGLSGLARRELVQLSRIKSNRDYARELERCARHAPELALVFASNLRLVEPVWYGDHEASAAVFGNLRENLDRLWGHAARA